MFMTGRALHRVYVGLLTTIAVLLAVLVIELWNLAPSMLPIAAAQVPDTALQRKQIVDEARRTNQLLSAILTHLEAKSIKVEMIGGDKSAGRRTGR